MAYSKTPTLSTYETKRVNIISNPQQRLADVFYDYALINFMPDVVESPVTGQKRISVKNRPGMVPFTSSSPGEGRGIFYWDQFTALVHVIGNTVYVNNTALITLGTSTGQVGIAEHVDQDAQHTLLIVDGVQGYVLTNTTTYFPVVPATRLNSHAYTLGSAVSPATVNQYCYDCTTAGTTSATPPTWPTTVGATVTDGTVVWTCREMAFPSPHVPTPIFLDGYMFLAKKDTQDIYNSDLNFPLHWSAGNFVSAEMYPDKVVALSKNNNFLYSVGGQSVQFFEDTANPTGTPLSNVPGAVLQFGCPAPSTVVQTEEDVILVGSTGNGGRTIWKINGFKAKEISIPAVCQALDAEGSNMSSAIGTCVRVMGQKLYVLNLATTTWVWSFTTQMWSQWSGSPTGKFLGAYTTATGTSDANPIWLGKTDGYVYTMYDHVYTDNGLAYTCALVTEKLDFDTINRKTMSRFCLIGDIANTGTTSQSFTISWSDDDYRTWTTPRTLNLIGDLPSLRQLGDFRRRAFRIIHQGGQQIRLDEIEVDINKGSA